MLPMKTIIILALLGLIAVFFIGYLISNRQEKTALKRELEEWEEEQRSFAQGLPRSQLYLYRANAVIFDPSYSMVHIRRFQDADGEISIGFHELVGIEKNMANYSITVKTAHFSHPSIVIQAAPGTEGENTQVLEQISGAFQTVIDQNKGGAKGDSEKEPAQPAASQGSASRSNPYVTSYSVYHSGTDPADKKPKTKNGISTLGAVGIVLLIAFVFVLITPNKGEDISSVPPGAPSDSTSPAVSQSESDESETPSIVYEAELTCGNYIAGIDFPAGTYDFLAISGNGNVMTNGSGTGWVNTIMGVSGSINGYDVTYQNVQLPEDVTLHIGGDLHLQIHSDAASGEPLLSRGQQFMDSFDLGAGDFVSGRDFKAGTYDIICTGGTGNISSGNVSGFYLNEVMGYDKPGYIGRADHIELPEGATLHVSGITVTMSPSE